MRKYPLVERGFAMIWAHGRGSAEFTVSPLLPHYLSRPCSQYQAQHQNDTIKLATSLSSQGIARSPRFLQLRCTTQSTPYGLTAIYATSWVDYHITTIISETPLWFMVNLDLPPHDRVTRIHGNENGNGNSQSSCIFAVPRSSSSAILHDGSTNMNYWELEARCALRERFVLPRHQYIPTIMIPNHFSLKNSKLGKTSQAMNNGDFNKKKRSSELWQCWNDLLV